MGGRQEDRGREDVLLIYSISSKGVQVPLTTPRAIEVCRQPCDTSEDRGRYGKNRRDFIKGIEEGGERREGER